MTKQEVDWNPEVNNDFKCLEWKAKIQAEILQDTEGMTDEEVLEYFRLGSARADMRRKAFARRQAEQRNVEQSHIEAAT